MALTDAIDMQNIEQVKYYVEHGADVNKSGWFSEKPLKKAIRQGNVLIVEYLVEHGAKVDTDCLYEAIEVRNLPIVKCLVEHGVDVNRNKWFSEKPLVKAIQQGDAPIAIYLVEKGAEIGPDYLNIAISKKNLPIVKCLVENDVKPKKQEQFLPLRHATHTKSLPIVKYLVEEGAKIKNDCVYEVVKVKSLPILKYYIEEKKVNIKRSKSFGKNLVIEAVTKKDLKIVQYLIEHGANIDTDCLDKAIDVESLPIVKCLVQKGAGENGLLKKETVVRAIYKKDVAIVTYLVEHGANIDTDCLNRAIDVRSLPIVECLVQKGVDIDQSSFWEAEPTIRAIHQGNELIVAYLIDQKVKNGAKVDIKYLNEAIDVGSLPVVKCLMEKGVDINWQSRFGEDPVIRGIHKGNASVVAYLIKKGSEEGLKIDIRYLNEAIDAGNLQVVQCVVDCGVNLNRSSWFSEAPIIRGIRKGNVAIVEYLISKGAKVDKNCLDVAIETGESSMVKCIVRQGVNANCGGSFDDPPSIIKAIRLKNLDIVKCLVTSGAKINDRCMNEAVKTGKIEIVDYFISRCRSVRDSSFLLTAVEKRDINMAKYLISKGSCVNSEQLRVATNNRDEAMIKLLKDNGATG